MIRTFCDDCQREIIKPAEERPVGPGQVRSCVYERTIRQRNAGIGGAGPLGEMCRECYERRGLHKADGTQGPVPSAAADAQGDINELLELVAS